MRARVRRACSRFTSEEVRWARRVIAEMGDGAGCVMIDGKMQDDATYKQCQVMVRAAALIARREPDYAKACGFSPEELKTA